MGPLPEEIITSRLTIRRWRVEDAEKLHGAVTASIEHLRPWMAWIAHEPLGVEDRRANIATWEQEWADGGDVILGVFLDGAAIGGCGLHHGLEQARLRSATGFTSTTQGRATRPSWQGA